MLGTGNFSIEGAGLPIVGLARVSRFFGKSQDAAC